MTAFGLSHEQEMQALREDRQRRASQRQAQGQFESDPAMLMRTIELAQAAPNASPGLITLSAMSGIGDEQFAQMAALDTGEDEQPPALQAGWWARPIDAVTGAVADTGDFAYQQVIKPFVRGVFTVAETLAEEVQRPLTAGLAVAGDQADSFIEAYNDLGPSVGVHALQQAAEGDGFDIGEGFFAGGAAREEQQQSRTLEIQGQTANFGRSLTTFATGGAVDPSARGYAAAAGILQFAADVGLDPTTYLTGGASKIRNAAKVIDVEDAGTAIREAARAGGRARDAFEAQHALPMRPSASVAAVDVARPSAAPGFPTLYHGAPRGITEFDRTGYYGSEGNIFGPGFYSTDARTVAQGYGRGSETSALHSVRWTGDEAPRLLDLAEPAPDTLRDILRRKADAIDAPDGYLDYDMDDWARFRQALDDPNATGDELYTGLRKSLMGPRSEIAEELADINTSLRDHYDVMRHAGGVRTGGERHNAYVWLDLERVEAEQFTSGLPGFNQRALDLEETERRLLAEAGAVEDSTRRGILLERAEQLFRSDDLLERIAESDAYDLMRSFRRSRANVIDGELLHRLGRTSDKTEIAELLLRAASTGSVRDRQLFGGAVDMMGRTGIRGRMRDSKFAGAAPVGRLDPQDPATTAAKLDSFLRQAGVEAEDVLDAAGNVIAKGRRSIFNQAIGSRQGNFDDMFNVARDAMRSAAVKVDGRGGGVSTALRTVDGREIEDAVTDMAEVFRRQHQTMSRYATDAAGNPLSPGFLGDADLSLPMMQSHLLNTALELPDVQTIRRAATEYATLRKLYQSSGWDWTTDVAQKMTRKLFKPMALLRPAYVVRIGAEEQLRLAGAGFDSIFTHPFRFITANVKSRKKLTDLVGGNLDEQARLSGIITREALEGIRNRHAILARNYDIATREGMERSPFVLAWRDEVIQLSSSPEARALARFRGNHAEFRRWARETPEGRDAIERMGNAVEELRPILRNDEALLDWAEANWKYVQAKTSSDDLLLDLLGEGRINTRGGRQELRAGLERIYDEGLAPDAIKVRVDSRVKGLRAPAENDRAYYDEALAVLFDNVTSKPSSYLARFPAYRQFMVRDLETMMKSMRSDKLRYQAIELAKKNLRLSGKEERTLRAAAQRAKGVEGMVDNVGTLNQTLVDRAAEQAKDLMFDLTKRSAAQEAFDVAIPFLDAWKEVTVTWARLVNENPAFFMRMSAGYRSADNQGVFYKNENGETVFAYPGSNTLAAFIQNHAENGGGLGGGLMAAAETAGQLVTGRLRETDTRLRMEGRVEGLNIAMQGVGPGFGPVVQWATGAFVPDTPDFRTLREFIAPFGTGGVESPADLLNPFRVGEHLLPSWYKKFHNAWTNGDFDEHQWNSTVGQAMSALATSGNYNPNDAADSERLLADSERAGRWVLMLRGALQFAGPVGPGATWELDLEVDNPPEKLPEYWDWEADPEGRFFSIQTLANEYRRLAYEVYDGDHELAVQHFVGQYGIEPFYVSQARTRGLDSLPVSQEGDDWVQANLQFAERHRSVAGYFAPVDGSEDLDFAVWREQIESGRRQSLTGEQQIALANQTKVRAMLNAAEQTLRAAGTDDAQVRQALSTFRADLEDRYPGWAHPVLGVAGRENPTERIDSLRAALQDPSLPDTPMVQPLQGYMNLRDAMLGMADERGYVTLNNQGSRDLRDILFQQGEMLSQRYPEFTGVWRQVLRQEVEA